MTTMNRRRMLGLSAAALTASTLPAPAQIIRGNGRILVGFPAGGPTDTLARRLAESLRGTLAESFVVENRPGAAAKLVIQALMEAPADGRTMLISPDAMFTIYPSVYKKLAYNAATDVTPVTPATYATFALAVGPMVPAEVKDVASFVAWAKANPSRAAYGSPAAGSTPHFMGELLVAAAQIQLRHVPYRGSTPAIQDLLGGHVASTITPIGDYVPHVASGVLRVIGVTDRERSAFLPNVPTFAEQGYAQVAGRDTFGCFLPKGAPPALAAQIAGFVAEAVKVPATRDTLRAVGQEPFTMSPPDYAAYLDRARKAWEPIVKASGFSLDE
ncbi:tripartite tricarboxylate transporter substrate-binding protein [Phreatobacter sp. HK31-P]